MSGHDGAAGHRRRATEVTTRMPAHVREQLREAARRQGVTMNAFMLGLLRGRLDEEHDDARVERRARELTLRLASSLLDHHLSAEAGDGPVAGTSDSHATSA